MKWIVQAALMAAVLCVGCGTNPKMKKKAVETVAVPSAPVVIPATKAEVDEIGTKVDGLSARVATVENSARSTESMVTKMAEKLLAESPTCVPEAPVIIPATKEHVDSKLKDIESLVASLQSIFASAHQNVGEYLGRMETSLTATQTNTEATNATLQTHSSKLDNLDQNVAEIQKQIQSFLEAQAAPAAPVPKNVPVPTPAAPPKRMDAPSKNAPEGKVALIRVDDEWVPINEFIAQWYKRTWSHTGTQIDDHLFDTHAVDPQALELLDNRTKEKLHSAIHERELASVQKRSVERSRTETKIVAPAAPLPSTRTWVTAPGTSQVCPNGKCPLVAPSRGTVTQQTKKRTRTATKRGIKGT